MIAFNYIAFLTWLLIVTSVSAFCVTLLHKWGVTEYVQIHGNDFFAKMFSCDFCLSWWVGIAITLFVVLITQRIECALIPFSSTILSRNLL